MRRFFSLLVALFFHRKTPLSAKTLLGAGALYGIMPVDFIPDVLPFIGEMDDLTLIILAIAFFWWKTRHVREDLRKNAPHAIPAK